MSTSVTNINPECKNTNNAKKQCIFIGWRKNCLYIIIVILMIITCVNLCFTIWILKVMEFSSEGMGQLKIMKDGLQLSGQTLVLDHLRASNIRSRPGLPISIDSSRNFSINTRDEDGLMENEIFLGQDNFTCLANNFKIIDAHGTILFSADREDISVGSNSLRVDGEGGIIFRNSIQTHIVKARAGKELILESPTQSIEMRASEEIFIHSTAGNIDANSQTDFKLHSINGNIRFNALNIMMPNLTIAQTQFKSSNDHEIYQVCICYNTGKLFLALPNLTCSSDIAIQICK